MPFKCLRRPTINSVWQQIDPADSASRGRKKKWHLVGNDNDVDGALRETAPCRSAVWKSDPLVRPTSDFSQAANGRRRVDKVLLPTGRLTGQRSHQLQDPCCCLNHSVTCVWTVTNRTLWHLCVDFHNLTGPRASYQLRRRWVGPPQPRPQPRTLWFDYVSHQDNPADY